MPPISISLSLSLSLSFALISIFQIAQSGPIGGAAVTDIFILAGQSNMAGRGGVNGGKWDGNVPPESRPNPAAVRRLSAGLRWEAAREPLHADIDVGPGKVCGVGPGMAFANGVVGMGLGRVVGLVPCAVGGTKIVEWARGRRLYVGLVRRANEAALLSAGRIRAVLWYQGESDTVKIEDAEAYERNLVGFINDLRSDLKLPNLMVALASGEGKYVEMVRRAQMEATRNLTNVKLVDAKGLQLKQDHLHLTTISEVHIGLNLAHAFLNQ